MRLAFSRSGWTLLCLTIWLVVSRAACADVSLDGKANELQDELQSLQQLLADGTSLGYALAYERADFALATASMRVLRRKADAGRVDDALIDCEFLLALAKEARKRTQDVIAKRRADVAGPGASDRHCGSRRGRISGRKAAAHVRGPDGVYRGDFLASLPARRTARHVLGLGSWLSRTCGTDRCRDEEYGCDTAARRVGR